MTIGSLRNEGMKRLSEAQVADASIDAALLLEHVMDISRSYLLAHPDEEADEAVCEAYLSLIGRRCEHVPPQHLTGTQEFMGLVFKVDKDVLIPRQDTECLVEEAMIETGDGMRVLDLCTGSGCILISLMRYKNDIYGVGTDISADALKVAADNARTNGVSAVFKQGDLYGALEDEDKFDIIISNPPYIRSDVIPSLMEEVRLYEPHTALDGGPDGLDFYRRIIDGAAAWLIPGGCILFEIGFDQAEEVSDLLKEAGYTGISVIKDLAGNDRVVKARSRSL
ncbi:MAG: peptide chain release factor N(5)-glutamine methyltransferase [Lachnospiraceae bacterium]|nr:peptide chain release factor N(5)-glutamine methyltransferase [Lachnospiraceae bacterium]